MIFLLHLCSCIVFLFEIYILALQIAAEVAAPLAKTDEIVLLGGEDKLTSEVTKLVSQLPPTVQALTGVDLTKVSLKLFYELTDHDHTESNID